MGPEMAGKDKKARDRSITSFLKDKYEGQRGEELTDGQLANLIYEDWMKLLIREERHEGVQHSGDVQPGDLLIQ